MKQLPKQLKHFELYLNNNDLGENNEIIKVLGMGIEQLPSDLQVLKLFLYNNNLGENDIEVLKDGCKDVLVKLEKLDIWK